MTKYLIKKNNVPYSGLFGSRSMADDLAEKLNAANGRRMYTVHAVYVSTRGTCGTDRKVA